MASQARGDINLPLFAFLPLWFNAEYDAASSTRHLSHNASRDRHFGRWIGLTRLAAAAGGRVGRRAKVSLATCAKIGTGFPKHFLMGVWVGVYVGRLALRLGLGFVRLERYDWPPSSG